jgi:hypothetical protein
MVKYMSLLDSSATTTMVEEIGTKKKVRVTHLFPSFIYIHSYYTFSYF